MMQRTNTGMNIGTRNHIMQPNKKNALQKRWAAHKNGDIKYATVKGLIFAYEYEALTTL